MQISLFNAKPGTRKSANDCSMMFCFTRVWNKWNKWNRIFNQSFINQCLTKNQWNKMKQVIMLKR